MSRLLYWLLPPLIALGVAGAQTSRPARPTSNTGAPAIGAFNVTANSGPGSVLVNLYPGAAVQRGARAFIGSTELTSGVRTTVEPSSYVLAFGSVEGFTTPKPITIVVSPGAAIELAFVYKLKPVPHILSTALPRAVTGVLYDATVFVSGSPTTITVSGLPAGLNDAGGGRITGTPTIEGTTNVSVTATNADGEDAAMLPLQVSAPGPLGAGRLEVIYDTARGVVEPLAAAVHHVPQGEDMRLTARPFPGFVFAGWQGVGLFYLPVREPTLQFGMLPDLQLEARFIPSPYRVLAGSYDGTLDGGPRRARLRLRVLGTGLYTGRFHSVTAPSEGVPLLGHFGNAGISTTTTRTANSRDSSNPLVDYIVNAVFDFDQATIAVEALSRTAGSRIAPLHVGTLLLPADVTTVLPLAGHYTAAMISPAPAAHGFGTFRVTSRGGVRFAGRGFAGEPIATSGSLNRTGTWAFFAETTGAPIAGDIGFSQPLAGSDASGTMFNSAPDPFPFQASRFTRRTLIDYSTATGTFGGGALTDPVSLALALSPFGRATDPAHGFRVEVNPANGRLRRSGFPAPANGARAIVRGVILQKSRQAYGQHSLIDTDGKLGFVEWQATP